MIHIIITGCPAPKRTWLYEHIGRTGRKCLVPTYQAKLVRPDGLIYTFAVTRDSANVLWRGYPRLGAGGECPPSPADKPYFGHIYHAKRNGPCLILSEGKDDGGYFLYGVGAVKRSTILVHAGPASSHGCFAVAGGKQGWRRFWQELSAAAHQDDSPDSIRVWVEPCAV